MLLTCEKTKRTDLQGNKFQMAQERRKAQMCVRACMCVRVCVASGEGRACAHMRLYFCCDVSAFFVFPAGPRAKLLNSIHQFTLISEEPQCLLLDT